MVCLSNQVEQCIEQQGDWCELSEVKEGFAVWWTSWFFCSIMHAGMHTHTHTHTAMSCSWSQVCGEGSLSSASPLSTLWPVISLWLLLQATSTAVWRRWASWWRARGRSRRETSVWPTVEAHSRISTISPEAWEGLRKRARSDIYFV